MRISFLGTSAAFPTAGRGVAGHLVRLPRERILFDCGEGTQRQIRRAGAPFPVDRIFLSHMHGDHVNGIGPYVGTMGLLGREWPLRVYAPPGTSAFVRAQVGEYDHFAVEIVELDEGDVVDGPGYRVRAVRVDHHGPSLGYRLDLDPRPRKVDLVRARSLGLEPGPLIGQLQHGLSVEVGGRTIAPDDVLGPPRAGASLCYSGDCRPTPAFVRLAAGVDLLVHEATFRAELAVEAEARKHSTSFDAAGVARAAGARALALVHVSHRHQTPRETAALVEEARTVFPSTFLPDDLDDAEIGIDGTVDFLPRFGEGLSVPA